jgi:hypothetical protein
MSARTCATAFARRLFYLRKVSLAVPWHSRQSTAGRTDGVGAAQVFRRVIGPAHGMGAAVLSAGDRAGKPDGPPIADEAQSPARDRFESS